METIVNRHVVSLPRHPSCKDKTVVLFVLSKNDAAGLFTCCSCLVPVRTDSEEHYNLDVRSAEMWCVIHGRKLSYAEAMLYFPSIAPNKYSRH